MAVNDTDKSSNAAPVNPGIAGLPPSSRRVDPRLWALLPVVALLILGAYSLGKYRTPEPPAPVQPVQQPAPVPPKGAMTVTELPPPITITPIPPGATPPAVAKPPAPKPEPAFKHEEPAIVLPTDNPEYPAGDLGAEGSGGVTTDNPDGDDTRPNHAPDTDAVKINDPALEYPSSAYEAGVEGTAKVTFTITPEGATTDASIEQSSGDSRLDQAALDYVKRLRFRPAMRDGQPVAVESKRSVPFSKG